MNGVELVRIGGSHCLFRPDTHALALLNDAATDLWRRIGDGGARGPTEERMINAWHQAGFLDERGLPPGIPAPRLEPHTGRDITQVPGVHLVVGGARPVGIAIDDERLSALLQAVLQPIVVAGPCEHLLEVRGGGDGPYEIYSDGVLLALCDGLGDARRVSLQALLLMLHGAKAVAAILHASAVEIEGRCLLIAGETGSGKSTLTAALVSHGARYLGDDLIALGVDGCHAGGFPIAASIKSGASETLRTLFPALRQAREFELGARRVQYLDLSGNEGATFEMVRIGALLFPRYTGCDAALETMPLTAEEAFGELVQTGTEIVGQPRSAKPLATLVDTCPAWKMRYHDLDAAVAKALALVRPA